MKHLIYTAALFILLLSGYACSAQSNNSSLQYTDNEAYVKQKVAEMLAAQPNEHSMYTIKPNEQHVNLQEKDPHAYWLYVRMMAMHELANNADDKLAWAIAMDTCIKEYNTRLGRKIGSSKQAMLAIEELASVLYDYSMFEVNIASGTSVTVSSFETINDYRRLFGYIKENATDSDHVMELYYKEFKSWFYMREAARDLMNCYTFQAAQYSMSTLEFHNVLHKWYKDRCKYFRFEENQFICGSRYWEPFKNENKSVSPEDFATLIDYFKTITYEEIAKQCGDYCPNYKKLFNLHNIAKYAKQYEKHLAEWYQLREQLALTLPEDRQESYREITKQMYATFYTHIEELKKINC